MWGLQVFVCVMIALVLYTVPYVCIIPWLGMNSRGFILLLNFLIIICLVVYTYYKACMTDPGSPPDGWDPDDEETGLLKIDDHYQMRYCSVCGCNKPPRTHHCSICNRCILRMDHHCPWLNNCVGYHNYKYFTLFVFYTNIGIWFSLVMIIGRILSLSDKPPVFDGICMWVTLIFMVPFALMLVCLMGHHIYLISQNYTTIEYHGLTHWNRPTLGNPYDLGIINNIKVICGDRMWSWLLPVPVKGDGINFQTASLTDSAYVVNIEMQEMHRSVVPLTTL